MSAPMAPRDGASHSTGAESGMRGATLLLAMAPILIACDTASRGALLALATLAMLLPLELLRWGCRAMRDRATWQVIGVMAVATVIATVDLLLRGIFPAGHADLAAVVPLLAIAGYATWSTDPQMADSGTTWWTSLRTGMLLAFLPLLAGALRELLAHASLFAGAAAAGLPAGLESHWSAPLVDGLLIAQRAPMAWLLLALLVALQRSTRRARRGASIRESA